MEASEGEITVLRYRCSIMCFAWIDAFATVLAAFYSVHYAYQTRAGEVERDGSGPGLFGTTDEQTGLDPAIAGVIQLIFLIGPICGYIGARTLRRRPLGVYLGFCAGKTTFTMVMAIIWTFWWFVLRTMIEMYIMKVVLSFWRALGVITVERTTELLHPDFVVGRPMTLAYW